MNLMKVLRLLRSVVGIFVIFLGVGYVIAEPPGASDADDRADLNFLRNIRPSEVNERERTKPKTPPKAQKQPDIPKPKIAQVNKPTNETPKMSAVPMIAGLDLGGGAFVGGVGGGAGSSDSEIVPIVKVNPQYPRSAAMRGTEGFVQLNVDIQKDGSVSNVRIVNSNPGRVFDRAAVSAASKYKYRPQIVDGKPTVLKNHGIQIDFRLDGN
jgi:protein TonB